MIRGGQRFSSDIDVTAASSDLLGLVERWHVHDNLASSSHNGISFQVGLKRTDPNQVKRTIRTELNEPVIVTLEVDSCFQN
ncbi:unnamed protein product [Euphydryas editha]|uniref:Uncharacterized protein n=1 Tax=Euphydryas editha TaxID=104508 RepID=A0AAU9U4E2_EUPED|nr:unnamed protein product [Euphydryas editha]